MCVCVRVCVLKRKRETDREPVFFEREIDGESEIEREFNDK